MRWISILVATCLVALGAMRSPVDTQRERHEPSLDDASGLVAKLAPRRPNTLAPDKRTERPLAVTPPSSPWIERPSQVALACSHAPPRAPWVPHLLARTSRGPPAGSSLVILHVS